jgi:hypothetical protein
VAFAADGWVGPANWGLRAFHDRLRPSDQAGRQLVATPIWDVPAEVTRAGIDTWLADLVERNEALRIDGRDQRRPDGRRETELRVRATGQVPVSWSEVGDQLDRATAAAVERYVSAPEKGFRATVLTCGGRPRRVVAAASFRTLDATGLAVLRNQGPAAPERSTSTVRDQLARESSDRFQQLNTRAIAFWLDRTRLAELPWTGPDRPGDWFQAVVRAPDGQAHLDAVADRLRAPSSAVLLAAVAVASWWTLARPEVPVQLVTSNRHLAGTAHYVGILAQWAPANLTVAPERSFSELVAATGREALLARRHAVWSPTELADALADGPAPDAVGAALTVNDARGLASGSGPDIPPNAVHALPGWLYQGGRAALAVTGRSELQFAGRAHTGWLSAGLLGRLLLGVPAVLASAAEDPERAVARLPPQEALIDRAELPA